MLQGINYALFLSDRHLATGLTVTGIHSDARPDGVCVTRGGNSDVVKFGDHEAMEG